MEAVVHGRLRSLDGLRGLAALIVVIHHVLLTEPELADVYRGLPADGAAGWLAYTPLHLLWAGGEAVLVFFVLSGLVLAAPYAARRPAPGWRAFYPRRLVRLYVPAVTAFGLALLLVVLRPAASGSGELSWWTRAHLQDPGLDGALEGVALVLGQDTWVLPAAWSLQWEVLFSLALPAYLLLLRVSSVAGGLLAAAGLLTTVGAGAMTGHASLVYLPVFGLGVLVLRFRSELLRLPGDPCLVAGLLVLVSPWVLGRPDWAIDADLLRALGPVLGAAGAALVVVGFLQGGVARWTQRAGWVQWLGLRSFSLFLVHEPVVSTVTLLLGGPPLPVLAAVAGPVALLGSEVFYRLVERPSHRLARRIGRHRTTESATDEDDVIQVVELPDPADWTGPRPQVTWARPF